MWIHALAKDPELEIKNSKVTHITVIIYVCDKGEWEIHIKDYIGGNPNQCPSRRKIRYVMRGPQKQANFIS